MWEQEVELLQKGKILTDKAMIQVFHDCIIANVSLCMKNDNAVFKRGNDTEASWVLKVLTMGNLS